MTRRRPRPKPPDKDSRAGAPDADERDLFRRAVGPVEFTQPKHRSPERSLPSTKPRMREADERAVMDELLDAPPPDIETGDDLVHCRPGIQYRVLKRLRRGYYRCQAEIDLHGMIVDVARDQLREFLQTALDRRYRCVRIVHGKGLRSGNRGPVLKTKVAGWLRRRDEVLAFCSARPIDGGTGAIYVLLKKT